MSNPTPSRLFDEVEHRFLLGDPSALTQPVSVTLQVTRRCNLRCVYCSESVQMPEPTPENLKALVGKLRGIERVILSGGEPTLRRDLSEIARQLRRVDVRVVAVATNATLVTPALAVQLREAVDYVDVTIDGTPETHNRIRGNYDRVLAGIRCFQHAGLPLCLVSVLLQDNLDDVLAICAAAEALGARKLKLLPPIRKERGQEVVSKAATTAQIASLHEAILAEKKKNGWRLKVTLTDWSIVSEGHALLVYPTGEVVCSPVPSQPDCIVRIGDLHEITMREVWERYPYKDNHARKYTEESLLVC